MTTYLSDAGRAFLRAFLGSLLVLAPGIWAAPNLNQAYLAGVAALIASICAGLKVLQVLLPTLSVDGHASPWGGIVDSGLRAFVSSLVVLLPGVLNAPDLANGKALLTALLIAVATVSLRVLQGLLTTGAPPAPNYGVRGP